MASPKSVIINAGKGFWYPKGTKRLVQSLKDVEWDGDVLTWYDYPNNEFDKTCPYTIKASCFLEAIKRGYTQILWCDSSVWAIKNPKPIFDYINENGYFFWKSGHNCAQTCSDNCLNYFGVDRDTAESYDDCSSGVLGVNLKSNIGKEFIETWIKSAKDGVFHGSRLHDNQSKDHRFMFHRQDQSAASVIIGKMGLVMEDVGVHCAYYNEKLPESIIFTMRGM